MEKTKSPVTAADLAQNGYKEQYGVIVICDSEQDQTAVFNRLKKQYQNKKIKVVTT